MKELHSFRDVIENRFFNKIEDALSDFVSGGIARLDFHSNFVHNVDEASICNLTIRRVDVSDAPGDVIWFDVIVETEIEISERIGSDCESDSVSEWFRMSCDGVINSGLLDFEITKIAIYSRYKNIGVKLTDKLVPVIPKERFDTVAEEFLHDCGFSGAVITPMPIPVREVARRMGLSIKETRLSRHFTIFGEMVFNDCDIECYDPDEHEYKPLAVKRGTILVDPNIYFMRNVGCMNNTIIHECFHWYKHRKHHELTGMYDSGAARISCRVHDNNRYRNDWNPEDWMEWQANGITSRILMPMTATQCKVDELINNYVEFFGSKNKLVIMEGVLSKLAAFFGVSLIAAKIRMIELGYIDVEGVSTYIDDHYISSYTFAAKSKNRSQTFDICLSDAFFEYFANLEFRQFIDSGNFTYIDGHYIIDDPKYVIKTSLGGFDLTEYAKLHMDECCIRFNLKLNPTANPDIAEYLDTVEFRKAVNGYSRVPDFKLDGHNKKIFARSNELRQFHEEYADELMFLSKPVASFADAAWSHIERLGLSRKEFCDRTLLSEKTYDRIKSNTTGRVTLQTVMQIAVGLELGGVLGEQLIELAGYKLTAKEIGYKKLLYTFNGHSIFECDEILTALGLDSIIPKQYRTVE